MSEEDDDEDEEEGKTAVQTDEKNKNNKSGLHGAVPYFCNWNETHIEVEKNNKMNVVIADRCDGFPENGQGEDSCQVLQPGHQGCDQVVTFVQKK